MGRVTVASVVERDPNNEGANPILVRFEHAPVKPNVDESVDLNEVFGTAVFENDKSASASKDMSHLNKSAFENRLSGKDSRGVKRKQVVALQSDTMTYIGTKGFNSPNLPTADEMMKTYIAIKDKKKLRIFEVTPVTVSPYLKGHSLIPNESRDNKEETTREEKRAKGIDLMMAFGSKRKRLVYERQEKNKIDIENMKDSMATAVEQLEVPEAEPVIKDDSILTLLPPGNRQARNPYDVYNLEDVLTEGEMDLMDEVVQSFLAVTPARLKAWSEDRIYSPYFVAMWTKLVPRRKDPKAVRVAKIVLYTELLIIFLKMRSEHIRRKTINLPNDFPDFLREKVIEHFTTQNANGTRNRSDACKDKLCCYIMVLVLLANDLIFDVHLMSISLNIHIKKLLTLARAVGITITYNASSKEYKGSLRLPIPKPTENKGRKRRLR